MDAFCGFVRGIRGNQRSSVFFPSKCGLFPANFQPPLGGENFIWPAPLAESRSEYISRLQNSGATFASCPFSDRGKSHSVRLRGVLIQNSPQTTKKRAVEKLVRVDENVGSVAFSRLLLLSRTCDGSLRGASCLVS